MDQTDCSVATNSEAEVTTTNAENDEIPRSAKKRKLEQNPFNNERTKNRLIKKLRNLIDEYICRVGEQIVIITVKPKKANSTMLYGSNPLQSVIHELQSIITDDLESAMPEEPKCDGPLQGDLSLFALPPLLNNGLPISIENMKQSDLRSFIPLMLKYSTGRGKPGWGKENLKPIWWPKELPWANIRTDKRSLEDKSKISWTHALRQVVFNCYTYHGRQDLLVNYKKCDTNETDGGTSDDKKQDQENAVCSGNFIVFKSEDGKNYTIQETNNVPFNAATYYTVIANANTDGLICVAPVTAGAKIVAVEENEESMQQSFIIPSDAF